MATRQRLVDGPDRDYLDADEVAAYLRMSAETLRRLVRAGKFPQPLEMTDGIRVWGWRDVLFWVLTVEVRPRLTAEPEPQPRSKGGQSQSTGKRDDSDP